METRSLGILFIVAAAILTKVEGDGVISFVDSKIYVDESSGNAVLKVNRSGGSSGKILFSCEITNGTALEDFKNKDTASKFSNGDTAEKECVFTIIDDSIPEGNETFIVTLAKFSDGNGVLGNPKEATITILANDKAYGVIGFSKGGTIDIQELASNSSQNIELLRSIGNYGAVSVDWQIVSGPNNGANDFVATKGTVSFVDGQNSADITLQVKPDNEPENDEVFTIRLTSSQGGAELNSSFRDLQIRIPANDAPVRFPVTHIEVRENQTTLQVQVNRGLQIDGITTIGNINSAVDINWYLIPVNAHSGKDFQNKNGTINFASGKTKSFIDVKIINDNAPELAENFTIHLKSTSPSVYIIPDGVATVTILPNDDQHGVFIFGSFPRFLDEDNTNTGTFVVNRTAGTFGSVSVSWAIVAGSGASLANVFITTSGLLNFNSGDNIKTINVVVKKDSIPEEAAEFYVQLSNPTGGSRLANTIDARRAVFYVKDSDDAYGVVDFAGSSYQHIIRDKSPRILSLTLNRTGGTLRSISVNYTVEYYLPGSNVPSNSLGLTPNGQVGLAAGQTNATFTVTIPSDGFIKLGSVFKVVLNNVKLEGVAPKVAPSTPRFGPNNILYLNISTSKADGEIGFAKFHQTLTVQEPSGLSPRMVELQVLRDGTAEGVTVDWSLKKSSGDFTAADAGPSSGTINFKKGQQIENLTIYINHDNLPELDEVFTVTLSNVSSPNKLQTGMETATITIVKNDNPGGTFVFGNTTPLFLKEGGDFSFDVIRLGSALDKRQVAVKIIPNDADFTGATGALILTFQPNDFKKQKILFVKKDNTPELAEKFQLILVPSGPVASQGILGNATAINITIEENEDPYGNVEFAPSDLVKHIDEVRGKNTSVIFTVNRNDGTFGSTDVSWEVLSVNQTPGLDIHPSQGVINFNEGDKTKPLEIFVLNDVIPEGNETFIIRLKTITGKARFGSQLNATLIINNNDDPVFFDSPTLVNVTEGQVANLTISRGGDRLDSITVTYKTFDGTAMTSDSDYVAVDGKVVFGVGEKTKRISIVTRDDNKPEGLEYFTVKLMNSSGDTVIQNDVARVTIYASDTGTGVFQFVESYVNNTVSEPGSVSFEVSRLIAQHGKVHLHYQILQVLSNGSLSSLPQGVDFNPPSGFIEFKDGQQKGTITINPFDDKLAEMNETFAVQIVNATGIGTGENGRLGNITVQYFTVLPNDDPYGVFRFDDSSIDIQIPEDYLPGKVNTTEKEIIVVRDQGLWGTTQVLWEISSADNNIKQEEQFDLLFLSDFGSGVVNEPSKRRKSTGTNVSCFSSARSGSYATVSLFGGQTLDEFSMSAWLQPDKQSLGYLLSYGLNGVVELEIAINTTRSTSSVFLSLFDGNVTVDLGRDISDGNWHEIVLNMKLANKEVIFYIDGTKTRTWSSFSGRSLTGGGVFTVGSSDSSKSSYTGCVQDIRVYKAILEDSKVQEMFVTILDLTPINGYLTFPNNVEKQGIVIKSVDDLKPEDQEKFRMGLITAKGGARLDENKASTTLTVLKSDNANGLFGFESSNPISLTETSNRSLTIERKKGTSGQVNVKWSIYKYSPSGLQLASDDFTKSQGTVVFSDGDSQEIFYIKPKDDQLPELDEQFVLKLDSATSKDGKKNSTPTSGASIEPNFTEINITVVKNDYPYGLFQFMDAVPHGNATIPPAVEAYHKDVRESSGTFDLVVGRAQGTEGAVEVAWRIEPGTAKAAVDYVNNAGVLKFVPGNRTAKISIKLLDDDKPELNKTFEVVLYDPKGNAELSPLAKNAQITILPSDDAFGVMNFSQDSLKRTVNESSTTLLTVLRSGGDLGLVTVYWKVTGPNSNDVNPMEGSVDLPTGKRSAQISIKIRDDVHPELSESFVVKLVNVSKGRLATTGITSNITIQASDHPYGVFQFSRTVLSTSEQNKTLSLTVKRNGGSYGIVRVYYKTHNFGDSVGNFKQTARPGEDFEALSSSLEFAEGVKNATIRLNVLEDDIPEDTETVLVSLTKVEIVKHSSVVPVPVNSPVLGSDSLARIDIQRNDNASGVVQLTADKVTVTEPYLRAIVNATRKAGAFGKIVIKLAVIPGTAVSSDYRIVYNNVTFQDGQTTAVVPVEIVNDNVPEKIESFTIKLLESGIQGGALLGYPSECTVTIDENDYPYGLIGFGTDSISIEVQEPSRARLKVTRTFGSEGANTVHWVATYKGMSPNDDITPTSGDLVFPAGSDSQYREKIIEIDIKPDNIPEIPEVIQITLTNVTSGKAVIDAHAHQANLTIAANDDPHGVVEFSKSSYTAIEGKPAVTLAYLEVKRNEGSFGNVRLYYSTKQIPGSNISSQDFNSVSNGSITIPEGQTTANITIGILNDTIPELHEMFSVVLESVVLVGQSTKFPPRLGALREANVTIFSNDDANGRFIIRAVNPDPDTGGVVKTVAEAPTSVSFDVIRTGGTIGFVTVKWNIDSSSNATADPKEPDFQGDGGTFDFPPGVTKQTGVLKILQDDIPETDETIVITLTNPTNGATVAKGLGSNLTIIISANDKVAGLVGFSKSSQSVVTKEGATVQLSVERSSPAAGMVRVLWTIHGKNASNDFTPSFGHVMFSQGQTKANISFQVRSDKKPEPNELFTVTLTNITTFEIAASGAAELIPDQVSATLSVQASDEPHGIIEFQSGSRDLTTDEANKTISLVVSRLYGTIGSIRVNYEVKTGNITALKQGQRLASNKDFNATVGSIVIGDGQSSGQLPVQIIDESDPEIAEVFIVNITKVELISSPHNTSGMAPKLGTHRAAQVTINSNDNPRGLLGFTQTKYYVNESIGTYDVIVERTQGTLGTLTVQYYIKGNTAIEGTDFVVPANTGGDETLTFKDGERTKNITINIKDDKIPEDDKLFRIHLKKTEDNTLRSGFTVAEVIILHNDDGRGVFSFETTTKTISEPGNGAITSATFKVVRKIASLGKVVVGWRILNGSASSDVSPTSGNLTFNPNDAEESFTITSLLDSTPEKDERFTIGLSIVSSTGGRIESPSIATLTIAENDYPYGELEILGMPSLSSSISLEENIGTFKAKVRRTKGNFGRISVSYETVQGSAKSPKGDMVYFETIQGLKTVGAKTWYSFSAYGDHYLILASNSSGNKGGYSGSSLYRWQGVFTKVQSITTDGAVNWDSVVINDTTYIAVANYGEDGRTETNSNVYRLDRNGHVVSIQNISTKGASDVKFFKDGGQTYLVFANSKSNNQETVLNSKVYRWQSGRFVDQNADFETRAASGLAVFSINGDKLLAVSSFHNKVSNSFQTNSPILKWQSGSFKSYKEVSTNGPIGVQYFENGGEHYLVFGNAKGPATVHKWKTDKFELVQSLPTSSLKSVYAYNFDSKAQLCTVDNGDEVKIYTWDNNFQLQMNTTVQAINSGFPVVIADPVAGDVQVIVAAMSGSSVSPVLSPVKLSLSADYVPRKGQLIFENGQTEIELDFTILQDNTPETDESFSIALRNATGKAVIGSKSYLTVTILSNDNAHGRIGFSDDSLKLTQVEDNTVVNFEVVREYGQSGRVVVLWNATGDYREGQISPVSGALVFDGRESKQNISIRLQDDHVPELDKVIKIRLLTLNETGSSQPGRGAVINTARALATLTIPGNDDPYGVISWLNTYYLSQASTVINKTVTLTITRTRGMIGGVLVAYQTQAPAGPLHSNEQSAVVGVDYVSKRGQVTMAAGVNSTDIEIEIMHNHRTSINKLFVINITAVTLQPGSPPSPLVTNSPRINTKARLLEVVISQNNQSLGEINFNISSMRLQATEGSTITLTLVRNGSVTGRVGLRYVVRPSLSNSVTPASSSDYTPENGTVYFEDNQTTRYISINVVKDGTPELAEEFHVAIVSPINGVGIGGKRRVDVEIKPNDDPQGVFGFKVSPLQSNIVEEGSSIRLEVVRGAGSYGQVDVTWRLEHNTSQLTPYNGTLTFKEGVRSQFIELFAVNDDIPEAAQQFDCLLVAVNNNAKINTSRNRAAVVIKENDNPQGVISIDPSTTRLFVGEPNNQGYDGVFVIRILRKIGQIGKASVSWKITRITSSASTASTTFNASSGNIEFTEGVKEIPVYLQVKQDQNPEEFASYLFKIDGRKGIDDNSTGILEATIDVAASDSPYGLIDFNSPQSYNVSEDIGFVNLTIIRNKGDIGHLKVNLTLSGSASEGTDFAISNTHLDFSDKERQKKVSIQIFNDEGPELAETIGVRIQSVELVPTRVMNYTIINGLQPDEPPKVGSQNAVTINILKNDNAHGVIQFIDTSKTIHEEDKRVVLMLERKGGTLGTVEVFFDVHNGTATFGKDYGTSKGSVIFTENQKDANITIPIIDDSDPEQQETFMVTLKSVTGGASLGTKKSANVIIVISDNPSGLLGFVNATELVLPNPNVTQSLTFGVARNGGAQGEITVKWQLMRVKPTDGNLSLDFFPKYRDTMSYKNGDKATQFLTIRLDAYQGPEPEEIYRIKLHDATGGADIDVLRSNITITVLKYGFPNGIFKFKDTSHRTIDEPDTGKTNTLPLTIERTIGFEGDVKVYWKAIGASTQDLVRTEGELLFKAGEKLLNLDVVVKGDDVPELSENFTIMLYKVDGGGDLDTRGQNVTVTIRANDDPHGVFKLKPGAQSLEVDVALSRTLQFTVQRDQGTFGDVTVDYSVTYSSWYPADLSGSLTVSGGAKEFTKKISLSKSAFLDVNSRFLVTLTRVKYISGNPAVVSSPKLASSSVSEAVNVPDSAANAVLRFADNSLKLAVASDNTATITVLRQGFYGDVSVTWKMGYPTDAAPSGYTAGQIEPATGSLVFNGKTNNKTFTVKANPVTPDRKLVYAVHLSKTTTSSNVAANITSGPKRTAVIEYSGVIEIAPDALSLVVTEGSKVSCRVVRLFSIFGSVRVTYNALGTSGSFNMADGEFSKSFDVTAPDNNNPENDYTLFINITQVTGSDTPRLGDKTVSTVTVKDNDNANGIISFKTKTLKVPENVTLAVTHKVSLELQRTGGTLGTVSVIVRTVGGGEPWDRMASPQTLVDILDKRAKDGSASVGKDYDQLLETVSFGPGVSSKSVQLTIRDDDVPEPDETVYVYLANVTGGAVLGTTESLQSWSVVTIEGNDLMNGQVGYVAGSTTATIDEDGSASATLSIERMGANFGSVTVVWRVREPSKRSQLLEYEGTAVFKPGVKEATFTIRLRNDKIPEFKDTFHVDLVELQNTQQARIDPGASSAVITVLDSDFPYGKVGFAPSALYTAVNLKTTQVSLEVLRSYGNTTDITVTYMTEMLPLKSTQLGIATSRAVVGQDYKLPTVTTLKLNKGETSGKMTLTLTPETPSLNNMYPKAFKVKIINVTNNAAIDSESSTATIIISNDEDTTRFLSLRASSRLSPLTDEAINNILADLKIYVKKPLNGDRKTLTKDTITNVLKEKKSRPLLSARKLQDISKTTIMDIFDELLDPTKSDTKGSTEFANLFDMFAFSLAYGETCPATNPLGVKGKYAYVTAYRKTLNSLNGLQINSFTSDKHFFSYPSNMFIGLDNKQQSDCNDVHFIEYHNSHWFSGSVLSDKVLSTSLNDSSTINKNNMYAYTYRIYTGKKRVTPKGASCVYWDFTKKEWSTSGCSVKSDKEDYVECQCNHMSNFASRGQSDDRVGYSTYFFAACFVCLGAIALALLSHHACSVDNLFSAKLLMHMFFACMAAHLMYVVGAYVSSSQAVITEDPAVRCSVLGMFIHYFFLCQFSWMFIQGWNLWRILVLNDEHTDRKYVLFFVLGWGMPVVAIVLYIIITQAAFSWSLHDMYGDVHKNGDMCFIPNAYAALASVVAPTLLFLMGVAVVFTQAYQVTMQWRYYDDIYRGHYNIKEVRHVILLFILVSITWLFAGLHLAYGYLWMVILFAIFDVMLGLYVFILYFILRNQVRGVFKRTYAFQGEPPPIHTHDDFFRGNLGTDSSGSRRFKRPSPEVPINISTEIYGDEPILLKKIKFSDWDDIDNTPRSNRKLMINMDDTGSLGQMNENFEDDIETQDFDDLIFALKTGGHFDPSEEEKPSFDQQEHFELRRISIPDTHL